MRVKKRSTALIVFTFLFTTLAVTSCGLLVASTQMISGWYNSPSTLLQLNSSQFVLEPVEVENSTIAPAWLGIVGYTLTPKMAQAMNLPDTQTGVLVQFVETDSPAKEAGLRGSTQYVTVNDHHWLVGGDVITALNDSPVASMRELLAVLNQTQPEEQITITVLRNGQQINLNTTLVEFPIPDVNNSRPGLRIT
jgi:S1-C subfamily serine protease